MTQTTAIFPVCQRINSLKLQARFVELQREKQVLFPRKNLCFVRPHFTLVKERLTSAKGSIDFSSRPNEHLDLKPEDLEASPLKREASHAHHCSMDSRHQRLAVYAYMWARQHYIQLKHIFFIRTKEQGIAWDSIRFIQNPNQQSETSSLAQKYAIQVVREKEDTHQVQMPVNPDPFIHLTRIVNYHS